MKLEEAHRRAQELLGPYAFVETRGRPGEFEDHCRVMKKYTIDGREVHLVEGFGHTWEEALEGARRRRISRKATR